MKPLNKLYKSCLLSFFMIASVNIAHADEMMTLIKTKSSNNQNTQVKANDDELGQIALQSQQKYSNSFKQDNMVISLRKTGMKNVDSVKSNNTMNNIKPHVYQPSLSAGDYDYESYAELDDLINNYVLKKGNINNNYASRSESSFIKPVNVRMNSNYGMRTHPISKKVKMHTGVDFAAPSGTQIKAAKSGYVTFSGSKGGYGNAVLINHNDDYSTLYGHASRLLVKEGQYVKQGDVIALVGSTGRSTGPHLHFEIFRNGNRINPLTKL